MTPTVPGAFSAGSQGALRSRNERAILEALLDSPEGAGLTRAALAEQVGLSAAGLANILAGPIRSVLTEADRRIEGRRSGPSPATLAVDSALGHLLAIDIGRRHVSAWLTDLGGVPVMGEPLERRRDSELKPSQAMDMAVDLARETIGRAPRRVDGSPIEGEDVIAVAVGLAHPVDHVTGTTGLGPQPTAWYGLRVDRELQLRLRWECPFHLESNAGLGALAELRWGASRGRSNVVHVRWAHEIRAGIVVHGRLYSGVSGIAGEIEHSPLPLNAGHPPEPCRSCGGFCVGSIAAREAIIRAVGKRQHEVSTLRDVLRLAKTHEEVWEVLDGAAEALGASLAPIVNTLNPEMITIGGDFGAEAYEQVGGALRRGLETHATPQALRDVSIALGEQTGRATVMGGIALLLERERVPFLLRRAYTEGGMAIG